MCLLQRELTVGQSGWLVFYKLIARSTPLRPGLNGPGKRKDPVSLLCGLILYHSALAVVLWTQSGVAAYLLRSV